MTSNTKLKLYTSHIDSNCEYNLAEFPDDISRMCKALWDMGYDVTREDIASAYGNWCEECKFAGWLYHPIPQLQDVIDDGYLVPHEQKKD